ncbi:hypothetical protein [Roseibacillus ishigakijimensis]|uniref:Uncharacterized protein n=1 Tax=Roseibacillus ishigakijimensis TaxID=454146 RepID=A0A934VNZ0_9BACT|nr:hypothetical protein [Roseibacillus ishigakijimensis]MBK1835561.1 hypothetical protein [Roseibacillus ishigakijimensis]
MKLTLSLLLACVTIATGIPMVPNSLSPDGKIYAVMDIDRDPEISPEWKGDSFPRIEITQKSTGRILASIEYFGSPGDDARPLREHVRVSWRPDSKAFGITIDDRFYSSCVVYVTNLEGQFVKAPSLPSDYEKMTGFPAPNAEDLRPRGREQVIGWDKEGLLIYSIFLSPLPSFNGKDPLQHTVYLNITPDSVRVVRVEHEEGEWKNGDWIPTKAEQTTEAD